MRLVGREKLNHLNDNVQAKSWLRNWIAEVKDANWKNPTDVFDQFPNVRVKGQNLFMFPISKINVAVELMVAYPQGIALITNTSVIDHAN